MADGYDVVVRGGTILDGSGGDPVEGDVAIVGGSIAKVGSVGARGAEEIDAAGRLVTPGFVDIHTHYDGQVTWESRVQPSSLHGVTTVVTGNCGVGFAPCRARDRETLIRLMEGVEDIPGSALAEGLRWNWESFGEYLEVVEGSEHDLDIATMVPHGALRVYVMGERGVNREPATDEDVEQMAALMKGAVREGALGFSTSRTMLHRTADGDATPMLGAARRELVGIARGVQRGGGGVFEMVSDFLDLEDEFELIRDVVGETRCTATYSLLQTGMAPTVWRTLLERTSAANAEGLPIRAQVFTRPVGVVMGLEATLHPFMARPSYLAIADLSLSERVTRLADPELRRRLISEEPESMHPFFAAFGRMYDRYFPLGATPDYEPDRESSVGAEAERTGRDPLDVVLDRFAEDEGRGLIYFPFANYEAFSLDDVRTMMLDDNTVFGLGDGGAHVGIVSDASATTTTLAHWGRDRRRGRLPLPWLVRFLTHDTSSAVGLTDRGLLRPGLKADLNVIDFDRLGVDRPEIVFDLPAGGRRFVQKARGYDATIVSGRVTYRDGQPTGALPGRLVRGQRSSGRVGQRLASMETRV